MSGVHHKIGLRNSTHIPDAGCGIPISSVKPWRGGLPLEVTRGRIQRKDLERQIWDLGFGALGLGKLGLNKARQLTEGIEIIFEVI